MTAPATRAPSVRLAFWCAAGVVVVDQVLKYAAAFMLADGRTYDLIPHVVRLNLVLNTGVAFGLFAQVPLLFLVTSCVIILVIAWFLVRYRPHPAAALALGLIMGGAAGNAIDRVRLGYIVDFIDFHVWPVFNGADTAISIGAVILMFLIMRQPNARRR